MFRISEDKTLIGGMLVLLAAMAVVFALLVVEEQNAHFLCEEDQALYPYLDYPSGDVRCVNIEELFFGGRILSIRGQDVAERDLRFAYQSDYYAKPQLFKAVCMAIRGLPSEMALEYMGTLRDPAERDGTKQPRIIAGAIARPGQEGIYLDKLRMAEILQDECYLLTPSVSPYITPPHCCQEEYK